MKAKTRTLLEMAHRYCDDNDKSTEFMLQYMQDFAHVSLDTVVAYLENLTKKEVLNPSSQPVNEIDKPNRH